MLPEEDRVCIWNSEKNNVQFRKEIRVGKKGLQFRSLQATSWALGDQNCHPVQWRLLKRMMALSQDDKVLISSLLPVTCM